MTDIRIEGLLAAVERLERRVAVLENKIKLLQQTEDGNVNLG